MRDGAYNWVADGQGGGPVTFDASGNLYGTCSSGGPDNNRGVVWMITGASLHHLGIKPGSVVGSKQTTGTITLAAPAPVGGWTVAISSDSTNATVPASVFVPEGATSANFAIQTSPVDSEKKATILSSLNGLNEQHELDIEAPFGLTLTPNTVTYGSPSKVTVLLPSPAPSGGQTFSLSSNTLDASVPAAITVAAGQTSATFTVTTNSLTTEKATISATGLGLTKTVSLMMKAPFWFTLASNSATAGTSVTATITLPSAAPSGGATFTLSSNKKAVGVPDSLTIPAGHTSATFTVTTTAVKTREKATISAKGVGAQKQDSLTVSP